MCGCDAPSFFRQNTVRGRKDYRCCECGIIIPKGTKHESITGCWQGDVETFRQCAACGEVAKDVLDLADCPCEVAYGQMVDWVHELRKDVTGEVKERFEAFAKRRGLPALATAE